MLARDWTPRPLHRVPAHHVPRARYPVIDVHKHLGSGRGRWPGEVEEIVAAMDAANVQVAVDLDGGHGDTLRTELERYRGGRHADRFVVFARLDWARSAEPHFGRSQAEELRRSLTAGASGLKIAKNLGLHARDDKGEHWLPDDPRLEPIWEVVAEHDVPVLIHVADPESFFRPVDRHNDRLPGLARRPEWYFGTPDFPPFERLIESQVRLFEQQPKVAFFGAHVLNRPEDLAWVAQVLERCPNVYADISARYQDLARQPRTARAFFERCQDKVVFGTDGQEFGIHQRYYRVLETEDDLILPDSGLLPAGTWPLYGMGLPDSVLRKLYHDNAAKALKLPTL